MKTSDDVTQSGAKKAAPTAPAPTAPAPTAPATTAATVQLSEIGNPDLFRVLYSWWCYDTNNINTVSAMEIAGVGCVVRVTNLHGEKVTESITFVPGVKLVEDINGGLKLRAIA